jgi:hypothetical protein
MRIIINPEIEKKPTKENYSDCEDDDVISVLSRICRVVDKRRLASCPVALDIFIREDYLVTEM